MPRNRKQWMYAALVLTPSLAAFVFTIITVFDRSPWYGVGSIVSSFITCGVLVIGLLDARRQNRSIRPTP